MVKAQLSSLQGRTYELQATHRALSEGKGKNLAIFHLSVKPISRGKGRSATAAAAYRCAILIRDERTGEVHDYRRKQGVEYTELCLPQGLTLKREELWNAAELVERRKDGRVAREFEIALPEELDREERQRLTVNFARELVRRYGIAADVAIHKPSSSGDPRNHHAHILISTRKISANGLGAKADLEREDKALRAENKPEGRQQIEKLREIWAVLCNKALALKGHEERISHKSLAEQGVARGATIHLGPVATAMERRGEQTERGDINRSLEKRNADWYELEALEQVQAGIAEARQKAHQWKKRQARAVAEEESRRQMEIERKRQKQYEEAILQREAQEAMPEPQVSDGKQERLEEEPQQRSLERF